MRLRFVHVPVRDLEAAVVFYRDELGLREAWREGDVVAMVGPGSEVAIMLDAGEGPPSPFFVVASVTAFHERMRARGVTFVDEPRAIGPGMYAAFTDPSGNLIRVMDDTTSGERS